MRRLADHVPGHALLAVVLGGHRADDLLSELVAVRLPLELVVSQAEIHEMPPNFGSRTLGVRPLKRLTDQSTSDRIAAAATRPGRSLSCFAVRRPVAAPATLFLLALTLAGCGLNEKNSGGSAAAPKISAKSTDKSASTELGFPVAATKNTTRVRGRRRRGGRRRGRERGVPVDLGGQPAARGRAGRRAQLAGGDRRRGADGQAARDPHALEQRRRAARGVQGRAGPAQPSRLAAGRQRPDHSHRRQLGAARRPTARRSSPAPIPTCWPRAWTSSSLWHAASPPPM